MKLKYEFELMEMEDHIVAVPVGDDADNGLRGIVKLNGTGADIFRYLQQEVTEDEIVAGMKKQYDATEEEIRQYVKAFVSHLNDEGLMEGV